MRSGYTVIDYGRLWLAGSNAYLWSKYATFNVWGSSSFGAFFFTFDEVNIVSSSGPHYRWMGFPLRCQIYIFQDILSAFQKYWHNSA